MIESVVADGPDGLSPSQISSAVAKCYALARSAPPPTRRPAAPSKKVLILPPDYTRYHSQSGLLTQHLHRELLAAGDSLEAVMPALGTHAPMTAAQIGHMFGPELAGAEGLFRVHDWRNDVATIGHVPAELVSAASACPAPAKYGTPVPDH
jgi:nickel-dependent lactate racemase